MKLNFIHLFYNYELCNSYGQDYVMNSGIQPREGVGGSEEGLQEGLRSWSTQIP